jgi:hypothetical protein
LDCGGARRRTEPRCGRQRSPQAGSALAKAELFIDAAADIVAPNARIPVRPVGDPHLHVFPRPPTLPAGLGELRGSYLRSDTSAEPVSARSLLMFDKILSRLDHGLAAQRQPAQSRQRPAERRSASPGLPSDVARDELTLIMVRLTLMKDGPADA